MLPLPDVICHDEGRSSQQHNFSTRLQLHYDQYSGFSPERWQKLMDVMILKRSGLTDFSSLRTIVLFPVDCNFTFKHIRREIMKVSERSEFLAPEQYGSHKAHCAIDLVANRL
jgi:hypothetical protein